MNKNITYNDWKVTLKTDENGKWQFVNKRVYIIKLIWHGWLK